MTRLRRFKRGSREAPDGTAQRRKQRVLRAIAAVLFAFGLVCLIVALKWVPKTHDEHVWHELFVELWPFFLTIVLAVLVYEFWLRESFVAELIAVSGPRVIRALRPRETLQILLDLVYGKKGQNRDVVAGVLGGFGEAHDHRDLSISQSTAVTLTLADCQGEATRYDLTIAAKYRFDDRPPADDLYVFFITTDPTIRNLLTVASSRFPVDFWYFPDVPDVAPGSKS